MSLLGGRTRSEVSRDAFVRLAQRFGSWSAVRDGSRDEIRMLIRRVTFFENKATYLKATLNILSRHASAPSLSWLSGMDTGYAHSVLQRLPGVGPKVASAVLNFSSLRRRCLVVDSHHLRVMRRLGFLVFDDDYAYGYRQLMPLLPAEWTADQIDHHHCIVKGLGQTVCTYDVPACGVCPLNEICPSARNMRVGMPELENTGPRHARFVPDELGLIAHLAADLAPVS